MRRDQHGQTPRPTTANRNHSTLLVKRDMPNDLQTSDNSNSNHDAYSTLDNRQLGGHSQIQHAATMLAAHHDQENVYVHQAGASNKQLGAKTPGARYPKTPLKIPLNDENANHGLGGGKGGLLQTKGNNGLVKSGKQALMTPAGELIFLLLPIVHSSSLTNMQHPKLVEPLSGTKPPMARLGQLRIPRAGRELLSRHRDRGRQLLNDQSRLRPKLGQPKSKSVPMFSLPLRPMTRSSTVHQSPGTCLTNPMCCPMAY